MLDKTTHPFIVNTLESNSHWSLSVKRGSSWRWWASLYYDGNESEAEPGSTPSEALNRLEALLAGREYVAKPRDSLSEAINNWVSLNSPREES